LRLVHGRKRLAKAPPQNADGGSTDWPGWKGKNRGNAGELFRLLADFSNRLDLNEAQKVREEVDPFTTKDVSLHLQASFDRVPAASGSGGEWQAVASSDRKKKGPLFQRP